MRFCVLFFSLILTCLCLTLAQGSYEDCCLKYVAGVGRGARKMVVKYRRQEMDGACNIPAVVFTLMKGRQFCADPREKWVMDLMQKIDKKTSRKSHRSHKGQRRG